MATTPSRALFLAVITTLGGCSRPAVPPTPRPITPESAGARPTEPEPSPEATTAPAPPNAGPLPRDELRRRLETRLERLDREIAAWRAKGARVEERARAEWNEKVAELMVRRDMARAKLDEALEATGAAWDTLRAEAEHAWDELERAIAKVTDGG
ncbi:MAG: hypothetical protein ACKOCW_02755 [Planctomycetaceae bacterium]